MTLHLRHSAVQSDTLPDGDSYSLYQDVLLFTSSFFFFKLYSHFVYKKIACCRVVRGRGAMNLSQKTHSEVCKRRLCIFVCKYIYTKHSCTKMLCGTPSLAKNKQKQNKKKVSTSFISIQFFLWIYGSIDTVIMDFVHLINRTTQSWVVLSKRSARSNSQRQEVPSNQPLKPSQLHTTATALAPE